MEENNDGKKKNNKKNGNNKVGKEESNNNMDNYDNSEKNMHRKLKHQHWQPQREGVQ